MATDVIIVVFVVIAVQIVCLTIACGRSDFVIRYPSIEFTQWVIQHFAGVVGVILAFHLQR
jgi:hypothetical protein